RRPLLNGKVLVTRHVCREQDGSSNVLGGDMVVPHDRFLRLPFSQVRENDAGHDPRSFDTRPPVTHLRANADPILPFHDGAPFWRFMVISHLPARIRSSSSKA